MLYGLAFAKAFAVSYVGIGICFAWGEAGWLVRWLLMFSSIHDAPLLYGFWLRHVGQRGRLSFCEAAWLASAVAFWGSIDSFIIAPMLARLIYS